MKKEQIYLLEETMAYINDATNRLYKVFYNLRNSDKAEELDYVISTLEELHDQLEAIEQEIDGILGMFEK